MSLSRRTRYALPLAAVLAAALLPLSTVRAATITVTTSADEYDTVGTGAGCSLREAIQAANADTPFGGCDAGSAADVILLPSGTYTLDRTAATEDLNVSGDLDSRSDVTIRGMGATRPIIDADGIDRVVDAPVGGTRLILQWLTLTGGAAPGGAGLRVASAATVEVTDSVVTLNVSTSGGGGIVSKGNLTVTRSSIWDNDAVDGGGIYTFGNTLDLTRASLTVIDSRILLNTAASDIYTVSGGGIAVSALTDFTMRGSVVSGNVADDGDGVHIGAGDPYRSTGRIENSTISGNGSLASGGRGGGIHVNSASLSLEHVTVSGNTASAQGGDGGNIYNAGEMVARNTLVHEAATSGNCGGPNPISSNGFNLEYAALSSQPCFDSSDPTNVIGGDPKLGALQDNGGPTWTHALGSGSAAIDQGATVAGITTDQRGVPRPYGPAPDIGAYERYLCRGVLVNRVGSAGNETLIGTAGSDGILGLGGNDRLNGLGGRDGLCGGSGNDLLNGGSGDDRLDGGGGSDTLVPGTGVDLVVGGSGLDTVSYAASASAVNVDLRLSPGTASGQGRDTISGIENVIASRFADVVRGSALANLLRLGAGADRGYGYGGADRIEGGTGNDIEYGGAGNDALYGNDGNDYLNGESGSDLCRQGAGTGSRISCER